MTIKQKFENLMTKIKDNSDEIVAAAVAVGSVVATVAAVYYKRELDVERRKHAMCHGPAKWLYSNTSEGTKTTIEVKGNHYCLVEKDIPTDE